MTYEEFERYVLRMVYEDGVARLQPSYLAYTLSLGHDTISEYLEHAMQAGVLELDVTEDGHLEYFIPGVDHNKPLPTPLWKQQETSLHAAHTHEEQVWEDHSGTDGSVQGDVLQKTLSVSHEKKQDLSPNLQTYMRKRYGNTDGSVTRRGGGHVTILDTNASIDKPVVLAQNATTAMVAYEQPEPSTPLMCVEEPENAFCDSSQTIFMRQIRVHGVQSEAVLRDHIKRLFESFGYHSVQAHADLLRFERGSVTFILALVPLFVLILPVFVYLFLYCMGRSTIQQEPVKLDVHIRRLNSHDCSYNIDLTFTGLHGVILGAADQRVLNQEVDTLRDELRWALSA